MTMRINAALYAACDSSGFAASDSTQLPEATGISPRLVYDPLLTSLRLREPGRRQRVPADGYRGGEQDCASPPVESCGLVKAGRCPRSCHTKLEPKCADSAHADHAAHGLRVWSRRHFCGWATWGTWGSCSASCGQGCFCPTADGVKGGRVSREATGSGGAISSSRPKCQSRLRTAGKKSPGCRTTRTLFCRLASQCSHALLCVSGCLSRIGRDMIQEYDDLVQRAEDAVQDAFCLIVVPDIRHHKRLEHAVQHGLAFMQVVFLLQL